VLFLNTGLRPARLAGLRIYPQPAAERLVVEHPVADHTTLTVRLLDGTGRIARQARWVAGAPQLHVDVAALAPGIYALELRDPAGAVVHRGSVSVLR
jgi:hypothetical protein